MRTTRVAIRALGPSLSRFGSSNVLKDPTLGVRDINGNLLIENDDWQSDQSSAAQLTANRLALPNPKGSGHFHAAARRPDPRPSLPAKTAASEIGLGGNLQPQVTRTNWDEGAA